MSDALLILIGGTVSATIGAGGAVAAAVVTARQGRRLKRVERDTAAAREQLENSHSTNLREEADERHHENTTKLDHALEILEAVQGSLRRLWAVSDRHGEQIDELDELTHPRTRSRFEPAPRHRQGDTP